mgnify:CR=1 FL=1
MSAASAGRAAVCISASLAGNRMEKLSHRLHPPKQRQRLMTECQYVLSGATENKFFHETDKWCRPLSLLCGLNAKAISKEFSDQFKRRKLVASNVIK